LVPKLKPGTPGFVSNPHFKTACPIRSVVPHGKMLLLWENREEFGEGSDLRKSLYNRSEL
jgi:hypothetical protein